MTFLQFQSQDCLESSKLLIEGHLLVCLYFHILSYILFLYTVKGLPLYSVGKNNLPAMQETWVQFLGWEIPLEKKLAIHSRFLARRIPWTDKPGRLQSMGSQESNTSYQRNLYFHSSN